MNKIEKLCNDNSIKSESYLDFLTKWFDSKFKGKHIISFMDSDNGSAESKTIIELYNDRVVVNTRPSLNVTNWSWKTINVDMSSDISDFVFRVKHVVTSTGWDRLYYTQIRIFGKQYTMTFDNIVNIIKETYKDKFKEEK